VFGTNETFLQREFDHVFGSNNPKCLAYFVVDELVASMKHSEVGVYDEQFCELAMSWETARIPLLCWNI
jgi:hypothetical protein